MWSIPLFFDWVGAPEVLHSPTYRNRGPLLDDAEVLQGMGYAAADLEVWRALLTAPSMTYRERERT